MTADIVQELNDEARSCINLADGAQNAIVNERENRLAMQFSRAAAEIVRLRVEVDADTVRDAERYRWLRNEAHKPEGMSPAVIIATNKFDVSDPECGGFEFGAGLDAAIDSAIKGEE